MANPTKKTAPLHYSFPPRFYVEWDCLKRIGEYSKDLGSRVVIISVQSELRYLARVQDIKDSFEKCGKKAIIYDSIAKKPSCQELDTLAYFIKQSKANLLLAYGGRESMYAARAAALLCTNNIFAKDLCQANFPLAHSPLPLLTVPLGPIMGEEISPYLKIYDPDEAQQFYKKDVQLYPKIVFSDPSLSQDLGRIELSRLGLACLSATIEAIMSKNVNDIITSQGMYAASLIMSNLLSALKDKNNEVALQNLNLASIFVGIAYSNSNFGLTYSLANCINNMLDGIFYTAMNVLLPCIMEYNLTLRAEAYVHIAKSWGEELRDLTIIEAAVKSIEAIRKLGVELQVPMRLSKFNINESQLPEIARQVEQVAMIHNNPRPLDKGDIEKILLAVY